MEVTKNGFQNDIICNGRIVPPLGNDEYGHSSVMIFVKRDDAHEELVRFALLEPLNPIFSIGDNVTIRGYTRSYSYAEGEGDNRRWRNVQYNVAKEIKMNFGPMHEFFGVRGHYPGDPIFEAYYEGDITSVIQPKNGSEWGKIILHTETESTKNNIILNYRANYRLPVFDYKQGDHIAVICGLNTRIRQNEEGRTVQFENLIVRDIIKIDEDGNVVQMEMPVTRPAQFRNQRRRPKRNSAQKPSQAEDVKQPVASDENLIGSETPSIELPE